MSKITELRDERKAVVAEQERVFAEYSDGQGGFKAITPEIQTAIVQRNKRMEEIEQELQPLVQVEAMAAKTAAAREAIDASGKPYRPFAFPGDNAGGAESATRRTLGQMFVDSEQYKRRVEAKSLSVDAVKLGGPFEVEVKSAASDGLKTLFSTTAGYAPFVPRLPLVIESAQRRPVVGDLIPTSELPQAGVRYMRETTLTNGAATVLEGASKPESTLALTEILAPMSKIANSIPVTEEELMDVPTVRDYLDNRMTLMTLLAEETNLLYGTGTAPDMTGFLTTAGTQATAKGTMDCFSALLLGIVKIEQTAGFANVTGQVIHPMDWYTIRTKQDSIGRFILGDPNTVQPNSIWGKPVIPTIAINMGTVLQGDFVSFSHLYRKEPLTFRVGYVNAQFLQNCITILCEMREALAIYRPGAFGQVTSAPIGGNSTF